MIMGSTPVRTFDVVLLLGVWALLAGCDRLFPYDDVIQVDESYPDFTVLDGDTLIFEGQWIRLRSIDAPELGPWADCWAEAALGGVSRQVLMDAVFERAAQWEVTGATPPDPNGMVIANLVTSDGHDLAEHMRLYGHAAQTAADWDWCVGADLHDPLADEAPPKGPRLWWPSNHMYDERAGD